MNLTDPNAKVKQLTRILRLIWAAMLACMGFMIYVFYGHLPSGPTPGRVIFEVLAVVLAGLSFLVPRWMRKNLGVKAANPLDAALSKITVSFVLQFALTEMAVLLLAFSNREASLGIFGLACVMMYFHFPTTARISDATSGVEGSPTPPIS